MWSASPRLGLAYPISARDVFSLAYVRIQQDPARDFLYESRTRINNRRPLGNPFLVPSTVVSYQAAVKHLFNEAWAAQTAVFYRDLFGQIGAREYAQPLLPVQMRYENADNGHAVGFELSLLFAREPRTSAELHYTYLDASGTESVEEGLPYAPIGGLRPTPIGEHPYNWDQRHTLAFIASLAGPAGLRFAWSTVAGSGLPWTPAELRTTPPDWSLVNTRRLPWSETSVLRAEWTPRSGRPLTIGCEVRNVFDTRVELATSVNGYPNPYINSTYDDYAAYRTETGNPGGAYWNDGSGGGQPVWNPVHDPRLFSPSRSVRLSVELGW
jgi:outer membrane receptor protein involved in Fe transport